MFHVKHPTSPRLRLQLGPGQALAYLFPMPQAVPYLRLVSSRSRHSRKRAGTVLVSECLAMESDTKIVPTRAHVLACIQALRDQLADLDEAHEQLAFLREAWLGRETFDLGARLRPTAKRHRVTRPAQGDRAMADTQAPNTDAIVKVINLLVDAFNDTESALGQGTHGVSFSAYGNLLPDIMGLAGEVGDLPSELAMLDAQTIATLVSAAAQKLDIPNEKARAVVDKVVQLLSSILSTTVSQAEAVAAAIKAI